MGISTSNLASRYGRWLIGTGLLLSACGDVESNPIPRCRDGASTQPDGNVCLFPPIPASCNPVLELLQGDLGVECKPVEQTQTDTRSTELASSVGTACELLTPDMPPMGVYRVEELIQTQQYAQLQENGERLPYYMRLENVYARVTLVDAWEPGASPSLWLTLPTYNDWPNQPFTSPGLALGDILGLTPRPIEGDLYIDASLAFFETETGWQSSSLSLPLDETERTTLLQRSRAWYADAGLTATSDQTDIYRQRVDCQHESWATGTTDSAANFD